MRPFGLLPSTNLSSFLARGSFGWTDASYLIDPYFMRRYSCVHAWLSRYATSGRSKCSYTNYIPLARLTQLAHKWTTTIALVNEIGQVLYAAMCVVSTDG